MSLGLEQGTVFAGRYRVERLLASGAMGAVYEAVHLGTGRRRALKVMHPHILERPELRERFELEARVTAGVSSDFIVEVFDAGIDEATGTPFLAMELLRGEELGKRLKRVGRLSPEEALRYLHQTALALDATHRASIVHRDLKPGNVFLVERAGLATRVKVLDFGVAKIVAESATGGSATQTVGTPYYMAPEQFRSGRVSPATDIYALGMLAYTLLVGEAYWADEKKGSDNLLSFAMIAAGGPNEPASVRAGRRGVSLPEAFDGWFARAAAVRPADRFGSATAAVAALGEVFGIEVPSAGEGAGAAGAEDGGRTETEAPTLAPDGEATADDGTDAGPRSATVTETRTEATQDTSVADPFGPTVPAPVQTQPASRAGSRNPVVSAVIKLTALLGAVLAIALTAALLRPRPRPLPPPLSPLSPLGPPSSVLACPILDTSKVDASAGWLGAAAAAIVCERARVILGGRAERTLVPAELLDLPRLPADGFPSDPFGAPDARARSAAASRRRAAVWVDGEVLEDAAAFRASLALRRPDGTELAHGTGGGRGLHEAVRAAMAGLAGGSALPTAKALDETMEPWERTRSVDAALSRLDLTLAMADNAGGLPDVCARLEARSAELRDEVAPLGRWLCAYTRGEPTPHVEIRLPPPSSAADYAAAARADHMIGIPDDRAVADEVHRLFEHEPSAWGKSMLAATESCLTQSTEPERAREMAMKAVQAEPKNPDGQFCNPWGQLLSVTRDTASAEATVRAMQAWEPWDSNGWLMAASSSSDPTTALAHARRAYTLSPLDTNVADALADRLLSAGEREETRHIAVAIKDGGSPVHLVESELLFVRIDASLAQFRAALDRARRASGVTPEDAGWVRVQRLEIAWRAVEVAGVLGRAGEEADRFVERFLDPEPPLVDLAYVTVPMRIPAICALASKETSGRCFRRFRSLKLAGRVSETEAFTDGAERYANGDFSGAARAWRPLLRDPGMLAAEMADEMAETFERTGETELVERLSAIASSRARELDGASPADVRAARRAAARGDRERARALAKKVIDAWSVADVTVPAVEEMRRLLARLR